MRRLIWLVVFGTWPAVAQEQQALTPPAGAGQPVYDMVAADRETAWRINRVTGEVTVCRVETAASLDGVRARCAPVIQDKGPQQSQTPPPGGINRP
jgi:hypothetical protein